MDYRKIEDDNILILGSSWSPRCIETLSQVADVLSFDKDLIYSVEKLAYKDKNLNENAMTRLRNKQLGGENKSEIAFIQSVAHDNELRNLVLSPYLNMIQNFFNQVERRGRKQVIIFFRHGEKMKASYKGDDIYNHLTPEGKLQAKNLGGALKNFLPQIKNANIRLLCGHNGVNECLVFFLFAVTAFPESWKAPLDYAEFITYIFEKQQDEVFLRVQRAGEERIITKQWFENLVSH